jgi:hypothetical protein
MSDRWSRLEPLTGVVFVALLIITSALSGSLPDSKASATKVLSYYSSHSTKIAVAAYITGLSLFFGLFFYASLRDHLSRGDEARRLAATAFGGAVLFAVGGGVSAGTQLTLAEAPGVFSPGAAQALNLLVNNLGQFALGAGIAVLMMAAGIAILRTGLLPVWLGRVAIVIAVVALTPAAFGAFLAAGLWTLIVSVILFRRQEELSASASGAALESAPAS